MKSYPAPPIPEATIAAMRRLVDSGVSQAEVISAMRDAGLSMVPSIKLLATFYGLSMTDAKFAVHRSATWADCRENHESLHESAFEAALGLGFEESTAAVHRQREQMTR